jgi:hypothetical protein
VPPKIGNISVFRRRTLAVFNRKGHV